MPLFCIDFAFTISDLYMGTMQMNRAATATRGPPNCMFNLNIFWEFENDLSLFVAGSIATSRV